MSAVVSARTVAPDTIHVTVTHQGFLVLSADQARDLIGELAAELLENHSVDRPMGQALGDLLEAMTYAMAARGGGS